MQARSARDDEACRPNPATSPETPAVMRALSAYRDPQAWRNLFEILVTGLPFLAIWLLMWVTIGAGYWAGLVLAVPAALLLVRLFIIQHDCGHRSFFRQRLANDWVGRLLGVVTLTPYDYWRHSHALHHAGSGNLDRRGFGDIDTLTVAEFQARPPLGRLRYRLYRHPLVMFGVGPAYLFLLRPLRDHPHLRQVGRITLIESLRAVKLVLWDEKKRRLVTFREGAVAAGEAN